ncbi:MAG: DNA helicase UvrD [Deltaproteobacteria bacterium HGW-Deltaproteobacteria-14]|jgi:superfamily I DNA/RNA helicase|nr:MAG: DNA helicase UvrD [Deltaproteobacteria bacterium HGW-Deltaproteobacteria-14]
MLLSRDLFAQLATLAATEQAQANAFIARFQENPAHPGIQLHRVQNPHGDGVWSARISQDLRAILYRDGDHWLLLHVDHHDDAYRWAERRRTGRNVQTGTFEIVDIQEVERVRERVITRTVTQDPPRFAAHSDDYLLSLGLPPEWLPLAREVRSEDDLATLCCDPTLAPDVSERLFNLGLGDLVVPPTPIAPDQPVTAAPDLSRRFYAPEDADALARALAAPLETWITFLHPDQRDMVARDFSGPSKVSGSAGTGKTIVAVHRAHYLAQTGERVLLTSFTKALCRSVERLLDLLCDATTRERIVVRTVKAIAYDIVDAAGSRRPTLLTTNAEVRSRLHRAIADAPAVPWPFDFIEAELDHVIMPQGITTWPEYRSARRIGRGTGLGAAQRKALWQVFSIFLAAMRVANEYTFPTLSTAAAEALATGQHSPYTAVIVDEVQDLSVPDIRLLVALTTAHPGHLMLVGDAGQRIYPGGFSLVRLGVETRGRSRVLRVNYRTTHQIRRAAEQVLGHTVDDFEEGTEDRHGTRSVMTGPDPSLVPASNVAEERRVACQTVSRILAAGHASEEEIGVFAHTHAELNALQSALLAAGHDVCRLDPNEPARDDRPGVRMTTMHNAKGLEFKAVIVHGVGADRLPTRRALLMPDPQDRDDAIARERRLLYVAMTRARDDLTVTWTGEPSPFLADLLRAPAPASA